MIGIDTRTEEIIGIANTAPIKFPGELHDLPDDGWNWAVSHSESKTRYHAGLNVAIYKKFPGLGYAKHFLQAVK